MPFVYIYANNIFINVHCFISVTQAGGDRQMLQPWYSWRNCWCFGELWFGYFYHSDIEYCPIDLIMSETGDIVDWYMSSGAYFLLVSLYLLWSHVICSLAFAGNLLYCFDMISVHYNCTVLDRAWFSLLSLMFSSVTESLFNAHMV